MNTAQPTPHIAFIGAGNMASAIAQGLHAQTGYTMSVADPHPPALAQWQAKFAAGVFNPVADAVVLAVKPQQFAQAAAGLTGKLGSNTLVISVMAGIPIHKISEALGGHTAIVRTMPNTPARIGQGITALFGTPQCTATQTALAQSVLACVGQTVWLTQESLIDAVTAVSGSGPAYVFYIAQAMTDAGTALGLPADIARQLTLATLQGAAALAQDSGEDLNLLREQVTSKGGTTAAALAVFKAMQLDQSIQAALRAAHSRAKELGI